MNHPDEEEIEDDIVVHTQPVHEEEYDPTSNLHQTQTEELELEPHSLANHIVVSAPKKSSSFMTPTQKFLLQCFFYTCCIIPILFIILFVVIFYSYIVFVPYSINYSQVEQNYTAPDLITGVLPNGMHYVIKSNNKNPIQKGRFSTFLHVPTGSSNEEEQERGIAHFCEHMAFDQSIEFRGRGGVWREIEKEEIPTFNAFTTFRSTVYMLQDAVTGRMDTIFKILFNQVQGSDLLDSAVQIEKGAVLGEARLSNASQYVSLSHLLAHHAGTNQNWRASSRLPIGTQETIKAFTTQQVQHYFDKWYRLEAMTLYVVGDVDASQTEKEIRQYWGSKRNRQTGTIREENLSYGIPQPVPKKIWMESIDHFPGIQLNLMMTEKRITHPMTLNQFRHYHLNRQLFAMSYGLLVLQEILSAYPIPTDSISIETLTQRMASAASQDFYMFNSTVSLLTMVSPETPSLQVWKRDFTIYTSVLKQIAQQGVSSFYLYAFSFVLSMQMEEQKEAQDNSVDNNQLIQLLLGEAEDPFYIPNYGQQYTWINQLSQVSMIPSIAEDVQYMGQLFYQQLMQQVLSNNEEAEQLYSHLKKEDKQVSLSIFFDSSSTLSEDTVKQLLQSIHQESSNAVDSDSSALYAQLVSGLTSTVSLQPKVPDALKPPISTFVPSLLQSNEELQVFSYQLANGIRVNSKVLSQTVSDKVAYVEIVSLGGKFSLTDSLHGACEFISTKSALGYRYKDHINIATGSTAAMPSIDCQRDYLKLSMGINLDVASRALEVLRLALRPWITPSHIQKAANLFVKQSYGRSDDPLLLTTEHVIPKLFDSIFQNETRLLLQSVNSDHIANLNAVQVQQWIDGQFTSDRMEINIVTKQVLSATLLQEINRWFGDLPSYKQVTTQGRDIYEQIPSVSFAPEFTRYSCQLLTASDKRGAFLTSIYPYHGASTSVAKDLFTQVLLRGYMFDEIRSKNGFGYFAIVQLYKSLIASSFGYATVRWAPGDYPQYDLNDPLNIETSFNRTKQAVQQQPVTEYIFDGTKNVLSSLVEMEMKKPTMWLQNLRGISLKKPSLQEQKSMVRLWSELDLPTVIRNLRYEEFKNEYNQIQTAEIQIVVEPVPQHRLNKLREC